MAVLAVAAFAPRTANGLAAFRTMLIAGTGIFVISVLVATINGAYGERELFTIPAPAFPEWLGGLQLGGPVTAEALLAASIRGLAILCVFLAFAVFNGAVSPARVLRMGPAAVFHAGLVVTIGLTLLPATIEDLRRLRELRALRGGGTGVRDLPALVVPALIGGLERAMRLAEAMEARGYAAPAPLPVLPRIAAMLAVPLVLVAAWLWLYVPSLALLAGLLALLACSGLAAWVVAAARARSTTRMRPERAGAVDVVAMVFSVALAVAAFGSRVGGWADLTYNPFSGLQLPAFEVAPACAWLALCAWPVFRLLLSPAPASRAAGKARQRPEALRS
ncbi:MAG: hypothetical protein U5Q44_05560 [Dehalococcoidia bacterium]|nr:hypothetical protein [Dehalococcoidia bacterium]